MPPPTMIMPPPPVKRLARPRLPPWRLPHGRPAVAAPLALWLVTWRWTQRGGLRRWSRITSSAATIQITRMRALTIASVIPRCAGEASPRDRRSGEAMYSLAYVSSILVHVMRMAM